MRNSFFLLIALFFSLFATAQNEAEKAESVMRSSGRIYVVIAVMVTILLGLILYLIRIDRKISKLEKE